MWYTYILDKKVIEMDNEVGSKGKSKKGKIVVLVLLSCLVIAVLGVYIGGVVYFSDRFFFNTQVNGVDFSRQTAADAREFVESKANDYYITIIKEDGQSEKIYASEIDFSFTANEAIEELFEAQNPFAWPLSLMDSQETYAGVDFSFNEERLFERVSNLEIVIEGQTSPVSADVIMEDDEVVIVPHQYGNVVRVDILQELILEYVGNFADEFNIADADIFVQPELTTESSVIVDTFENANRYLSAEITYSVGSEVVVDRTLISEWLTIDDDFNVHLDEELVQEWLNDFISTINTLGTTRELTTPRGRNVTVTGGDYGWSVYRAPEFAELLENIRNGDVVYREPIYWRRAASHGSQDWGDTFLQVDLTEQHMWAIVNGEVVFESPVVTGRPQDRLNTPQGVNFILEKLSPTVLTGATNRVTGVVAEPSPVDYWMRVTWSGIGFHDATWQTSFGGTHYRTNGSHGCINLPLEAASELYRLVFINMPVVIHY